MSIRSEASPGPGTAPRRSRAGNVRLVAWQVAYEQKIFWRQGFGTTATIFMPLLFLVLFGTVYADTEVPGRPGLSFAAWLVPGIIAFGIAMATLPTVAVSTAGLREKGILRRYHTTPLSGWVFTMGRVGSAAALSLVAVVMTLAAGAAFYGASLRVGDVPLLVVGVALGTACFTSLGLTLARLVRKAESVQPISVAILIPLSMISGVFLPGDSLPPWLDVVGQWLPLAPLAQILEASLSPDGLALELLAIPLLLAWTAISLGLARGVFSGVVERA